MFLCSTVNGYEGTGRSLSLKLIQQLREQAAGGGRGASGAAGGGGGGGAVGRTFREVTLDEPIRWGEQCWLELPCSQVVFLVSQVQHWITS